MPLYQYTNEQGLKILKDLTWKVTPPDEFNDPLEMSPRVKSLDPRGYSKRRIAEWLSNPDFYNRNRNDKRFSHFKSYAEFQQGARPFLEKEAKGVIDSTPILDGDHQREILHILSATLSVVCFTRNPVHPLMWAHYAAK